MILARTQSGQKQQTGGCNSGAVAIAFGLARGLGCTKTVLPVQKKYS